MDATSRILRARIGAYALHAQRDTKETTKAARAAFAARFLDEVDPDRVLPEPERQRRAEAARRAYFARLAPKRSLARKKGPSRDSDGRGHRRADRTSSLDGRG